MQGIRPLFVASLIVAGCARAASPSAPAALRSALPEPAPSSVPARASAPAAATKTEAVTITRQSAAEGIHLHLGELYDDVQAQAAYARQAPGVTISGEPNALRLVARFGAWWQGGELNAPPPLTSVRLASLDGLDAEQARAITQLFVDTHVHEAQLWLSDPTSLASSIAAAKSVVDDPRAHGDCRAPCVAWPWQTRWSVLEIGGRAAWREGDNTRDVATLEAAIARIREARQAIPDAAHPLTAAVTERLLAVALQSRAEVDPDLRDMAEAVAASRRAVALFTSPDSEVDRSFTNSNLQDELRRMAQRDNSPARYDEALAISKDSQKGLDSVRSPLALARALWLRAEVLQDKYDALDDRQALTAAREQLLQASALVPPEVSPLFQQSLSGSFCAVSSELGALNGDLSELEQGVQACERALALAPEVTKPRPPLTVSYGLALSRLGESRGDVGLLKRAIAQVREGLANFDPHTQPSARAKALNNLAVALRALSSREDLTNNLELAAAAFQQSLTLSPKRSDPVRWAKNTLGWADTERRLGWVERSRLQMDAAKAHYEKGLRAIDDALTGLTQKNQPTLWATLQERAGDLLAREGEIAEGYRFNQAVGRYQLALRVNRRETDPAAYARTQFGLGVAYLFWADQSSGIEHIRGIAKKSVAAFREALAVRAQLGLVHTLPNTKAHLADAVAILDRVSYRSTCEPQQLFAEAVHDDAKATGLWEPASASLARYQQSKDANKCSP